MADMEMDDEETTPIRVGWKSNLIPRDDKTQKILLFPISHVFVVVSIKKSLCIAD